MRDRAGHRSSLGSVAGVIVLALAVAPGRASAQNCTVTGNSVTCTGGPGASVTIPSSNSFTPPQTVLGSPYRSELVVSGAPTGAAVAFVTATMNGYNATGPSADGNNSADVGILLADDSHNLQIVRCAGNGGSGSSQTNLNLTLADGAPPIPACTGATDWPVTGNQTYAPSAYDDSLRDFEASPNYGVTIQSSAATLGSGTLGHSGSAGVFTGDVVNGTWNLYLVDDGISSGAGISFTSWSITIFYTTASTPSTTTLTPSDATAFADNIATLTASVTSGATGTMKFEEGAANLTCSEGSPVVISSGAATCTTTLSIEGVHILTAQYSGDSTFVASSGTANIFIQNHAANLGATYCNHGGITNSGSSQFASTSTTPYPSVIFVGDGFNADITNFVSTVSVQLINVSSAGTRDTHFLLVAPDGVHAFDFWSDITDISSGDYLIQDGSARLPASGPAAGTFAPTAYSLNNTTGDNFLPGPPTPAPQVPASFSVAAPAGSATFENAIGGAPSAHGAWSLFAWSSDSGVTTTIGGWCLNITPASGTSTSTAVSPNPMRAALGQPVTFTAAIGGGVGSSGTVTFTENGSVLAGAPNGGVANVLSGVATIATSLLPEGDHTVTASYSPGSTSFNGSFGITTMRVDNATTTPTFTGNTWTYCNTGAITIPSGTVAISDIGPAQPNPSNVFVTNLPGTISSVSITLDGFQLPAGGSILESLLVGPNGGSAPRSAQTLDFFSLVGNDTAFGPQNMTFEDASGVPPCSVTNSAPFAVDAAASCGNTSYTASQFYTLPSSVQQATPAGNFTFNTGALTGTGGGVYLDTNPDGPWSLYFNQTAHNTGGGVNGWCLNFVENPVTVGVTTTHIGTFTQGQQGAQFNVVVINTAEAGSTGDPDGSHPLTITDVLASDFTPGAPLPTGTPWNCSVAGQAVTCVSDNAVAPGNGYPGLTIPVNVSSTAGSSETNSVSVSGGGILPTSSNTDTVTIGLNTPQPPSIAAAFNPTNIPLSGASTLTFTITNPASNTVVLSAVGFTDTLPSGLVVASPNGVSNTCGGLVTAPAGSGGIGLTGGSVAANSRCTVVANIAPTQSGIFQDTASLSSGGTAAASLSVIAPPSIRQTFTPALITVGSSTSLTFSITNPAANATALSGVGFLDSLPSGLTISNVPVGVCNGGTVTTNAANRIVLSNGSIGSNAVCQFSVTVTGAVAGNYTNTTGIVASTNAGTGNSASASLTVQSASPPAQSAPNNLSVRPTALSFTYTIGQSPSAQSQSITVGASATFTLAATVSPGAGWLSATATGNDITATTDATGLAAGTYQGSLSLSVSLASQPVSVPVTLTVVGENGLVISVPSLFFTATDNATTNLTQSMQVSAQGRNIAFTVSSTTPWLSVTSDASTTPASLSITVTPGTLPVGAHSGSFQIAAPGSSNSPLSVPATLNIVSSFVISSGGFENSASSLAIPGAANAIMAFFGNVSCPVSPVVSINGSAVPVIGSTASQVNFTLPPSVAGASGASVVVDCNGLQAASALLPLAAVSPGIYTLSMTGTGQGAILNQDGTVNGVAHSAPLDTYLQIYATGLGAYLSPSSDGLQRLSHTVQASVGGISAQVEFAGHAPDFTLGLQQINVLIPANAPVGPSVPIQLTVDGVSTQPGVTAAIQSQ
jgi:uncharacterized protein (TIGR03437 family)